MRLHLKTSLLSNVITLGFIVGLTGCSMPSTAQFDEGQYTKNSGPQIKGTYYVSKRQDRRRSQRLRGRHKVNHGEQWHNPAVLNAAYANQRSSDQWPPLRGNMPARARHNSYNNGRYYDNSHRDVIKLAQAQPYLQPPHQQNYQVQNNHPYPHSGKTIVPNIVSPNHLEPNHIGQSRNSYRPSLGSAQSPLSISSPQAPARSAQIAPWTSFQQSLGAAQRHSQKLVIEDYKIKEAQEVLEQAKSQSRFKLDLNANTGLTQSETVFNVVDRTDNDFRVRRSAELDLSLPLYEGGRLKAQKESAKIGVKAAGTDFLAVESEVIKETALAYLDVLRDRDLVGIYQKNVGLLLKQQETAALLLENGENTLSDKALIDTRLASVRVSLQQAETRLKNSETSYRKLVGHIPSAQFSAPEFYLPQSLFEVKAIAQNNNPEIRAAKARAEGAKFDIDIAKSAARPKLALQGILRGAEGQSNTISRDTAAEVLLNFRMPLLSGGENKSKVRQALLAQSRITHEIHDTYDTLNERIEQLWNNLNAARTSTALYDQQIKSAHQAYDTITQQKEAGLATVLDQLSVEQTLLDAYVSRVESQAQLQTTSVQLLSLMGKLS